MADQICKMSDRIFEMNEELTLLKEEAFFNDVQMYINNECIVNQLKGWFAETIDISLIVDEHVQVFLDAALKKSQDSVSKILEDKKTMSKWAREDEENKKQGICVYTANKIWEKRIDKIVSDEVTNIKKILQESKADFSDARHVFMTKEKYSCYFSDNSIRKENIKKQRKEKLAKRTRDESD